MQFSQETDYALRLVDFFARCSQEEFLNAKELSQQLSIPYRFLLRVLGKLKRGGILRSKQGENGGYRLARPAGEITFKQVIELVENTLLLARCLKDTGLCNAGMAPGCRVHKKLHAIQNQVSEILATYTFDDPT